MDDFLKEVSNKGSAYLDYRRSFLIDGLPAPMTPADPHLQIFDNYINGTAIRLRSVRDPESNSWERSLEKEQAEAPGASMRRKLFRIPLLKRDYEVFKPFEGNEIRKNRYLYASGRQNIEIDIFLGPLWGLNIATARFDHPDSASSFRLPDMSLLDISENDFFLGRNLVDKSFAEVRIECDRLLGVD